MKNIKLTILGIATLLFALTLNFRHAIDDYGVLKNKLHVEVLAQTTNTGGGSTGGGSTGDGSYKCQQSCVPWFDVMNGYRCPNGTIYSVSGTKYSCVSGTIKQTCKIGNTSSGVNCSGTVSGDNTYVPSDCK